MNALFQTIRSLAVEFIKRLYVPIAIMVSVALVVLLGLSLWLTTISDWWWILAIFVIGFALLVIVAMVIVGFIMKFASPAQTKAQKRQAKALVDKMQHLAEVTATPKFVLFFQVIRDVLAPSSNGFIASVSDDTSTLRRDFNELKDSFR
jgi:ABC-type bacteriocin/lantibiotic exporter with double-glycine peptidase domain